MDCRGRSRPWLELRGMVSDGALTYFRYLQITSAIPVEWRRLRAQADPTMPELLPPAADCVSRAKQRYIASLGVHPTGQMRWTQLYPDVSDWDWAKIWKLPGLLHVSNRMRMFQFKVLHRTLVTPRKLFLFGQRDSAECYACRAEVDNIDHMLATCPWSD